MTVANVITTGRPPLGLAGSPLTRERRLRGETLRALARRSGVAHSRLSEQYAGKRRLATINRKLLASALGLSLDEIEALIEATMEWRKALDRRMRRARNTH